MKMGMIGFLGSEGVIRPPGPRGGYTVKVSV